MNAVKLGRKYEGSGPCAMPAQPSQKSTIDYPTLHIECDGDQLEALGDLPECGTMVVQYQTKSKEVRAEGDTKTGHLCLSITKILSAKERNMPVSPDKDSAEALDDVAKDVYAEGSEDHAGSDDY